jgi:hypothetical protein
VVGVALDLAPAVSDGDDRGVPRLDLLDVPDGFGGERAVAGDHREDGRLLGDQRQRAVLQFAGGEPLGVFVGDLLQLEGALQRDGVVDAAADEEVRRRVDELLGDRLRVGLVEHRLHVPREVP